MTSKSIEQRIMEAAEDYSYGSTYKDSPSFEAGATWVLKEIGPLIEALERISNEKLTGKNGVCPNSEEIFYDRDKRIQLAKQALAKFRGEK